MRKRNKRDNIGIVLQNQKLPRSFKKQKKTAEIHIDAKYTKYYYIDELSDDFARLATAMRKMLRKGSK